MKISARNFCLAKSVVGDDSDNIPGVPGVGFKTLAARLPKFALDEDYDIGSLLSDAACLTKIKAMSSIASSESIIRRNWSLCYLDTANLAGTQIERINGILDCYEPVRNKLSAKRILVSEGLPTIGIDSLFFSLKFASGT